MSEQSIENITKSDSIFAPTFVDHHLLSDKTFSEHCLMNNISIPKKVINVYISDALTPWLRNLNTDFTLNNVDSDKCRYSIYRIRFDSHSEFLFTDRNMGRKVIVFGADMSQ